MKGLYLKIGVASFFALIFFGCSSQRPILDFSEVDSFRSELQNKSISLVVLHGINLLDFKSSFESTYGTNQKSASELLKSLSERMESKIRHPISDRFYIDETQDGDSNDKKIIS